MSTLSTRTFREALSVSVYGLLVCMALWLGADAAQAGPAAGTLVTNQARGTFIDSSGRVRTDVSNVVQIFVGDRKSVV